MNLIVFDIDDTLTRSEYQHQLAYVQTMQHFGITTINENWKTYKHHTDSYILKENYENNLNSSFDFSFIPAFEKEMTARILQLSKVSEVSGAKKVVSALEQRPDYAVAFATGSLLEPAYIKLNQAEIPHNKALVVGSNTIYEREGIVTAAIEKAKAVYDVSHFENIISVGDGIWDLKAAQNLNLHFIGIGLKNYPDFKNAGIKAHIEDWKGFDLSMAEQQPGLNN